jgi:hypothetical protein
MQCAKCLQVIDEEDAVIVTLQSAEMEREGESQTLFLHKPCLRQIVAPSVPLHPDLEE